MATPSNESSPRLLVRPAPFRGESLRGYFLRVSEMNGYGGDVSSTSIAAGTFSQFNVPETVLERMGSMLGLNVEALERMAYRRTGPNRKMDCDYLGHNIRGEHLHNTASPTCPLCIRELGATSALWDLRAVTVCVQHACRLMDDCSGCGKPLKWSRSRIGHCDCGFPLGNLPFMPASPPVIALTAALEEQVFNDLPRGLERPLAFPSDFRTASLNESLNLFEYVATWRFASRGSSNADGHFGELGHYHTARTMARLLTDWPERLYLELARPRGDRRRETTAYVITEREFWRRLGGPKQVAKGCARAGRNRLPNYFVDALNQYLQARQVGHGPQGLVLNTYAKHSTPIEQSDIVQLLTMQRDELEELVGCGEVSRETFNAFVARHFRDAWSWAQARTTLDCTNAQLAVLSSMGLISCFAGSLFRRSCVSLLLSRLQAIAQPLPSKPDVEVRPLNAIGRDESKTFGGVIAAVLSGRLSLLCDGKAVNSLGHFFVPKEEVHRARLWLRYEDRSLAEAATCF